MKIIDKNIRLSQKIETRDDYIEDENNVATPVIEEQPDEIVLDLNDDVVDNYLEDNQEEEPQQMTEAPIEQMPLMQEPDIDVDVPEFSNAEAAMKWAIEHRKIVKIFYITSGRSRSRGGKILKREQGRGAGKQIYRIVEPHHLFHAKNGNTILVTYDRSVQHIRAFIVKNIMDYNFTDKVFKPRISIVPRFEKGIKEMKNTQDKLSKIASQLEKDGLPTSSAVIHDSIKAIDNFKKAQYVGIQGYWVRNKRCWDNCYRQKRTSQPKSPAQEVWNECWEEYKKSINDDNSGWEKYASEEGVDIKDKNSIQKWNKFFISKVESKMKEGMSLPESVYASIEEECQKYSDKVVEESSRLMVLAESFSDSGYDGIGDKLADLALDMIKEAAFEGGWWNQTTDFFRTKKGKIAERINRLIRRINKIMVDLQGGSGYVSNAESSSKMEKESQQQPLSVQQQNLYHQFISDVRQEMAYLNKVKIKNQDLMGIIQPAVQAMGQFLTNSDNIFRQNNKKFDKPSVMNALSDFMNVLSGVEGAAPTTQPPVPQTGGGFGGQQIPPLGPQANPANAQQQLDQLITSTPNIMNIVKPIGKTGPNALQQIVDLFNSAGIPFTAQNISYLKKQLGLP